MQEVVFQLWHTLDTWASGQPIYIQAAIGAGIFWVLLQVLSATIRLVVFIGRGLFQSRKSYPVVPSPKKRPEKPTKPQIDEEETPSYFFR